MPHPEAKSGWYAVRPLLKKAIDEAAIRVLPIVGKQRSGHAQTKIGVLGLTWGQSGCSLLVQ
jgi:hypothetical protein